ncbi:hypothetical protein NESM_000806700 [Novymonas esmeraldas]|uniref:Uncharacterized protein n=1 Tax=Novymonas esmeraldas TaxID=1808958 RepID=A0AAW0F001_9TRYP
MFSINALRSCCCWANVHHHDHISGDAGDGSSLPWAVSSAAAAATHHCDALLSWLPAGKAAQLRRELALPTESAASGSASSRRSTERAVGRVHRIAAASTAHDRAPQPDAAACALALLSVALQPLEARVGCTVISATHQAERLCATLLQLFARDAVLDLDEAYAEDRHTRLPLPCLAATRQHLAASLRLWLEYLLHFSLDWLHSLQYGGAPPPGMVPAAVVALASARASGPSEEGTNADARLPVAERPLAAVPGPLRGVAAELVRRPLHLYAQALRRAAGTIEGSGGGQCECDTGSTTADASASGMAPRRSRAPLPAASAKRRRGASPVVRRRRARHQVSDSSSSSSSDESSANTSSSTVSSPSTPSPPLADVYAPAHSPIPASASAGKPAKVCPADAAMDLDDTPLALIAERLRVRRSR